MIEQELLNLIRRAAADLRWLTYHTFRSRKSEPGFPDLTLARDTVIYSELKGDSGHPLSVKQAEWLLTLHRAGQEVYLWRPADLSFIYQRLARRGRFHPDLPAEVYRTLGLESPC